MRRWFYLSFVLLLVHCSSKDEASTYMPIVEPITQEGMNSDSGNVDSSNGNADVNDEEQEEPIFPNGDSRVLFVGNSLTYFNNLPELVESEAAKNGYRVTADMLAKPNYAILDHWADGEVLELIKNGNYDYLVIQQGPSSQEWGRQVLFEYGEKYNALCSVNGTALVYFMVWPSQAYYYTFPGVIKNYREASMNTNSILCPVGEVWKNHFDSTGDFSYYGSDGFHPSLQGSTVAAKVITDKLYPKSPKGG